MIVPRPIGHAEFYGLLRSWLFCYPLLPSDELAFEGRCRMLALITYSHETALI